jgi:hypothetical protein
VLALPDDLSLRNNAACDHSVISEISERTGAFSLPGVRAQEDSAAVRELLRAGGAATAGGAGGGGGGGTTAAASRTAPGCTSAGGTAAAASCGSSPPHRVGEQQRRHHHHQQQQQQQQSAARSSTSFHANHNNNNNNDDDDDDHGKQKLPNTSVNSLLEDVRVNYAMFKASRCRHHRDGSGREETGGASSGGWGGGVLRWIAEDAQFCGWYLCGIDTTTTSAKDDRPHHQRGEDDANAINSAREARKKAAELTFLGREIEICGGGGGGGKSSAFCIGL